MTIDVLKDETLTLAEAARRVPGQPHPATVWRWCRRGCRGVRLAYARIGGLIVTTEAALAEFSRELTTREQAADIERPTPSVRPHRGPSDRDLRDAEAALAAEGL